MLYAPHLLFSDAVPCTGSQGAETQIDVRNRRGAPKTFMHGHRDLRDASHGRDATRLSWSSQPSNIHVVLLMKLDQKPHPISGQVVTDVRCTSTSADSARSQLGSCLCCLCLHFGTVLSLTHS
jgi:hypothetical protein